MRSRTALTAIIICSVCSLVHGVVAQAAELDQLVEADIPQQKLDAALLQLARRARVSIVFPQHLTASLEAPSVHGPNTLGDMLYALLESTDLEPQLVDGEVIAIVPRPQHFDASADRVVTVARPTAPPQPLRGIEEIRVVGRPITGSRIRRADPRVDPQVQILDRDYLELTGQQTLADILRRLPAVAGNSTSTQVTNGGDGSAMMALRGLPVSNTLVLIDGRRLSTDAFQGRGTDLNAIPLGMVERVEVFKDGASAIYGSDAIAGVVNVITGRHLSGLHLDTYFGASQHSDLKTTRLNMIYGSEADGWAFDIGMELYDQQPIWSRDRSISHSADDRPRGGIDGRSSATAPARIMLDDAPVILASSALSGSDASQFRAATDEDRFDFRDFTTAVVPSKRASFYGHADVNWGDSVVFLETLYSRTQADNTLAPTPLFTGFESVDLTVSAANPFNPFGEDIADVRRRILELPARQQENDSHTLRGVLGIRGSNAAIDWEAAFLHSQTRARETLHHVLDADRVQRSLGPADVCAADPLCVPLNLFGPVGSITAPMLGYVRTHSDTEGYSRLESATFDAAASLGALPGGNAALAAGMEFRNEHLDTHPDTQMTVGGANLTASEGGRNIWEWYGELSLPLLAHRTGVDTLELDLAARTSHYSDFGWTTNPRMSLVYQPARALVLRAAYAEAFRAPTLQQLHIGAQESFAFLNDPCAAGDLTKLPGCTGRSDPTLVQFLAITSGNRNLLPERARSYSVGAVWQLPGLEKLQLALDYFHIRERNVVDASAQFIVNENAYYGAFTERVERDDNGNIARVLSAQMNIGQRDVSGVDLALKAELPPTALGTFELAVDTAYLGDFSERLDPTAPIENQAGTFTDEASDGNGALPHWKGNVALHWRRERWEANYTLYYVSQIEESVPALERQRTIDAWRLHNLQLNYHLDAKRAARMTIGVNNLLNTQPPFSAAAFNDSFDGRTYDLAGRFLYARITKAF